MSSPQTKLVAPHMSALSVIAALMSDSVLSSQTKLQHLIGAAKTIPGMKLQPEHVVEVTKGLDRQIDEIRDTNFQFGKAAIEHLTTASEQLVANNKVARNGHADDVGSATGVAGAETKDPTDRRPAAHG